MPALSWIDDTVDMVGVSSIVSDENNDIVIQNCSAIKKQKI